MYRKSPALYPGAFKSKYNTATYRSVNIVASAGGGAWGEETSRRSLLFCS